MDGDLIFVDTETTSLDPWSRRAWDIGYIVRRPGFGADLESQMFVEVDLADADPMSLEVGGYYERHPNPYGHPHLSLGRNVWSPADAARAVARKFRGATLVGAVPWFDELTLASLLRDSGLSPTWRYHLVDVEALAAGQLGLAPPWNFDRLLDAFGLRYADEAERHTALGDARMVRDLYDAVLGGNRVGE